MVAVKGMISGKRLGLPEHLQGVMTENEFYELSYKKRTKMRNPDYVFGLRPKRPDKRIPLPVELIGIYSEEKYNSFDRGKRYNLRNPEKRSILSKKAYKRNIANDPEYNKKAYWGTKKSRPEVQREWHLNFKFGISQEQYMEMFNRQDGLCGICGNKETAKLKDGRIKWLAVDHDHITGQIRKLLCQQCNNMLGNAKDSEEILLKAVEYLRKWSNVGATRQ